MLLLDEGGRELDAEFEIERTDDGVDVILHSRSGNKGGERNPAYNTVLQLILERMRRSGATLLSVVVDSTRARTLYPQDERTVELNYPVNLDAGVDLHGLRVMITEGQRLIASEVDPTSRGGNKHKRVRLSFLLHHQAVDFERLLDVANRAVEVNGEADTSIRLGREYYDDLADPRLRPTGLYSRDDEKLERSLAEHAGLQRNLARHLRTLGFEPRKRASGEPDYDIAWRVDGRVVVGEVKSLTGASVDRQLRVGLGQVLHYSEQLRRRFDEEVGAVLIVPQDPGELWLEVCMRAGVIVTWPPDWSGVGS